jgi:hypothetical protein
MRDQQPHGIDPGDPPDAHLQSHVLDSNPLIDAEVCLADVRGIKVDGMPTRSPFLDNFPLADKD